MTLLLQL